MVSYGCAQFGATITGLNQFIGKMYPIERGHAAAKIIRKLIIVHHFTS